MTQLDRRQFIRVLGSASTAFVLAPILTSCASSDPVAASSGAESVSSSRVPAPPDTRPSDWDAVAYNRTRANAGAVPASYLDAINAADGAANAIGKHLPYIPQLEPGVVPEGMVAIMWGDPSKGHAAHPNAVRNESNHMEGHWYDWIEARKAVDSSVVVQRSTYPEWPAPADGRFAVRGGGDITADAGKNTVYLVALPPGVGPGDTVRIFAHCLTHGEYVDFITLPA